MLRFEGDALNAIKPRKRKKNTSLLRVYDAPFRKGSVFNGQMTKESNKRVRPPPTYGHTKKVMYDIEYPPPTPLAEGGA